MTHRLTPTATLDNLMENVRIALVGIASPSQEEYGVVVHLQSDKSAAIVLVPLAGNEIRQDLYFHDGSSLRRARNSRTYDASSPTFPTYQAMVQEALNG